MSTTATATRGEQRTERRLLHGLTWLFLRQHRGALGGVLALAVLGSAWILHQRAGSTDVLDASGWPGKEAPQPVVGQQYSYLTLLRGSMPALLGEWQRSNSHPRSPSISGPALSASARRPPHAVSASSP